MPELNSLPPMTTDELRSELKSSQFTTYVFIGDGDETGWRVANAAQSMLAALLVFRAADVSHVEPWAGSDDSIKGLVFGWGDREYYPAPRPTFGMALRAALQPSAAVVHLAGLSALPSEVFPADETIRLTLSAPGFRRLALLARPLESPPQKL